jgi:prolyl-tRNA editing enzyme YbaK/EbsC (Cys-tRNA(Pro) deacylase)
MASAPERVQQALDALNIDAKVEIMTESARTAQQAADALNTTVAQIVKSLVFVAGDEPLLVETSGSNRVDLKKLETILNVPIRQANAKEVRAFTGFAIGGIPPVGHAQEMKTLIDEDLLQYDEIFAAGGIPESIFKTTPQDLLTMTGGQVAEVKE